MKIAVIHSIYKPESRGGAEIVVGNIVDGLKAEGHEVFVITVGRSDLMEEIDGVKAYRVKPINLFNFLDIGSQPLWKRFFWHIIDIFNDGQTWKIHKILSQERPDLALTHSLMGLGFELPMLLRLMGIKQLHTIHDMQLIHPSGLLEETQKLPLPVRAYAGLCRWLFGSPAAVIYPSEFIKGIYGSLKFFPKSRAAVLGNPLPVGTSIGRIKEPGGKLTMAYVGQIEAYKGVIDLIKVVSGLPGDWELLIAGDGSAMRDAVKWSLDEPKIKLLGRLDSSGLDSQIWSQADILINPSKVAESFGLVVIEAYARGIPVVAAKIGALPDLVKEGETGWLFKSGDQLDLKRCIEFILSNRDQAKALKDNCLLEAAKYDLANYLRRLLELA